MQHDRPLPHEPQSDISRVLVDTAARQQTAYDVLAEVPIFASFDEQSLWRLAHHANARSYPPGSLVLIEGDETDGFFVVESGVADVMRPGADDSLVTVAQLGPGSYFGELGLLTDAPRNATVIVGRDAPLEVLAFDAQTFHEIIAEHVLVFRMQRARKHLSATPAIEQLDLSKIAPFSQLSQEDLAYVLDAAEEQTFERGETVFDQGAKGDRFYVVLRGALAVERDGRQVGTLTTGDFFGETALLFTRKRTATVRAVLPSSVWSITRRAFSRIVRRELLDSNAAMSKIESRRAS